MSNNAAFLGVSSSVSGKRWELRDADEREALAICQRFSLPDVVGRFMAARGISLEESADFLTPSLKALLPDPHHLKDMDKGVERLVAAIRNKEPIAVFGDYDVDGATSSAVLNRFFSTINVPLEIYIPDRMKEGYGPNLPALRALAAKGIKVVITVDCGITAFEALEGAAEAGLDIVVVDHHVAEPSLPKASAVINPNRLDDDSPHGHMAAVGVTFLLVVALNKALREAGYYGDRPAPDLRLLLDLVALGTVCDVVPLRGVNRAFVAQGLKILAQRRNKGLAALADVSGVDRFPEAYHLGYQMGPRVNAGGRVGESYLGARLLSTDNPAEARDIAQQLNLFNQERKEIEAACLEQAIEQVESRDMHAGLVYAAAEGWHPGVIGIVAGRLKERYNRPACVVAFENGIGKGSGRSIEGVDLGATVIAAGQADLLINGGGHKMAAGFTVAQENSDAFRDYLAQRIEAQVGTDGIIPRLSLDGTVTVADANIDLVKKLEQLGPFGAGNSTPRFVLPDVVLEKVSIVGTDHVRCQIKDRSGRGGWIKAIAFRCADQPLGDLLLGQRPGMPVHLCGKLQIDTWQGRENVQFMIDDAAPAYS
ncbi:single-stranded-DNA-specific exonuclease RecJ [Aestuariispira insulae]|uniref:Single-stranded-DNA-specific exonuclease RecJ n=1 Tax=Aestuariispira insulae TaxID=1461337 RepID=A0A3D9HV68_9PROT|nr:single-stranded-DNA-specific exonuclease RecJ [Aestuariispira insulae]RED53414.1 exonuclease RecJ [Aestuariispira insulae]